MTDQETTVILANGEFPNRPELLALLRSAPRVICCDGAADALLRFGRMPDFAVGDGDSILPETRKILGSRLIRISNQETNDLTKCFNFCRENGWKHIVILGAGGKRDDHLLGNLSLLADYAMSCGDIALCTNFGVFRVARQSGGFPAVKGQQISIFALESGTAVTSRGLKYPLHQLRLDRWWQATLNEAEGDTFHLDFTSGKTLLIYWAYQQ